MANLDRAVLQSRLVSKKENESDYYIINDVIFLKREKNKSIVFNIFIKCSEAIMLV